MHQEKLPRRPESAPKLSLAPPAIESFLDPVQAAEVWPPEIATHEAFIEQCATRQELTQALDVVLSRLPQPDISLEAAIAAEYITEDHVAALYTLLSSLLEGDSEYRRIALYLPFEFLPDATWQPAAHTLQQAIDRFKNAYRSAWERLLSTHDVRANFVDGDVLEAELRTGDHPRVVKAAHLIPLLVKKDMLNTREVITLMEASDDQVLNDSIADTLPVLADWGLLTTADLADMAASDHWLVRNMAKIITADAAPVHEPLTKEPEETTAALIQKELQAAITAIDTKDYGAVTPKRAAWLRQQQKQDAIEAAGKALHTAITTDPLSDEVVANFLATETDTTSAQVLISGIRQTIESVAATNPEQAQAVYAQHRPTLLALWQRNIPELRELLSKTFYRLHHLRIVDDNQLAELTIAIPNLAGPFSENFAAMQTELRALGDMIASVESNPELSRLIHPIVLAYGSRLKGYGSTNADIDIAVFIRPGVPHTDRPRLQALLETTFAHEKIRDKVVEFWLDPTEQGLEIHNFSENDASLGESYWTHVLFGAAWEGAPAAIQELRKQLLTSYLYDTKQTLFDHPARALHLEELERDTLQYRLMHKGYERFFPPAGGVPAPHADAIDGHSVFWDSGYRQLATKLFASQVFLPKLPVPENKQEKRPSA